ncbi:CPBP family intramembrane metalloprotease [Oceanobacillus iheyensis]|uniref:CPBP family intramembrane metalloprotease n=1 Tax=Oceanobacillus jordanicus TaxID=2867266 RepID=A0AAW5B6H7_9BACI|nr:CPBP family intramembrane glutamic endopeptidase [Oceanobacillus jordanicus]AVQ99260.1 CPBP family intramembrane metalloprotease [Oceanobacillus iheyensis]MCG3418819.1 CPBP family intramembrane metalloprotease [Oceanobacillus jordanicus]
MSQREIILGMTDRALRKQVILSQGLLLAASIILSLLLFDSIEDWFQYFNWNPKEIFYFGLLPGIIIVLIDVILMRFLPKSTFDDGGVNEKLFTGQPVSSIFFLSLLVAWTEEMLFRGVIQTSFGYVFASVFFAIVHIRYLKKPILLASVLMISFYIGYLFEQTGNLFVTITAHFIVDFLLGVTIRYYKGGIIGEA